MSYDRKAIDATDGLRRAGDPRRVYATGDTPPELAKMLLNELDRNSAEYQHECERRRRIIRRAFRSNALAGLQPNPDCQKIFDAYIVGQIKLAEMMPLIRMTLGLDPKLNGKTIDAEFLDELLLQAIRNS